MVTQANHYIVLYAQMPNWQSNLFLISCIYDVLVGTYASIFFSSVVIEKEARLVALRNLFTIVFFHSTALPYFGNISEGNQAR